MNELSLINELPSTGNQIAQFVRDCKAEILASHTPMESLIQLRAALKAVDNLASDDDIIKAAIDEFDRIGEKKLEVNGVKIEKVETGVRYDFKSCNDREWNELSFQESEIISKRKARESILKVQRHPDVDNKTGEVTIPYIPAVKTSKTNLKITIE